MRRLLLLLPIPVLLVVLLATSSATPATPPAATLKLTAEGVTRTGFDGWVGAGTETGGADRGKRCFGVDGHPDPGASGCDVFTLTFELPQDFARTKDTTAPVRISNFGGPGNDLDLFIYRRNADGTAGRLVTGAEGGALDEVATIDAPSGMYYAAVVPAAAPAQTKFNATAELVARPRRQPSEINATAPPGGVNFRGSHDQFTSHSEPTIAMDPLDHNHLIAGSKMYESNKDYLFKIGTYESFDGGRTWEDYGHLPGYCQQPGECDPKNQDKYRMTSDITLAFDDEGNAYANVLDAPGNTYHFTGFNMTAHIKQPGKPWSNPIVVHDNRASEVQRETLLDDKNWIAVDNHTDTLGQPNKPKDGKIGTLYICWGLDQAGDQQGGTLPTGNVPAAGQIIVVERSIDGGHTWGGFAPGDNTPKPISQDEAAAGIGCQEAIGPNGEVYITWLNPKLSVLMFTMSVDRGVSWTPARPVATLNPLPSTFDGETFRNTSMPTMDVDANGKVYLAVASVDAGGQPVSKSVQDQFVAMTSQGRPDWDSLYRLLHGEQQQAKQQEEHLTSLEAEEEADDGDAPGTGGDIVLYTSDSMGATFSGPVRVNQDPQKHRDQFQPWLSVTPKGTLNISYFDRRNDPRNLFIDTYLSRSADGGKTFTDTRVTERVWDPRVNAPTSVSGQFIGDYQGIVSDDDVAIPFWNDTQDNQRDKSDPEFSQWQEVHAARVRADGSFDGKPPAAGGQPPSGGSGGCLDTAKPAARFKGRARLIKGRLVLRGTATDRSNCASAKAGVARVVVSIARKKGRRCRFLRADGRFSAPRRCSRLAFLPAKGRGRWSFRTARKVARGRYQLAVRAIDVAGNASAVKRRTS